MRRPGKAAAGLNLEGRFNWAEPLPPDLDDSDVKRRRFWYFASAYLVRAADEEAFTIWVGANAVRGWKMPEPVRMSELFLGEYGSNRCPTCGRKQILGGFSCKLSPD